MAATTKLFEPTDPEWLQLQGAMSGYGPATLDTLSAILQRLAVPARGIIVYDDDYRPAGAALAINAGGTAIFLNVVVAQALRGQGYGRAVMNAGAQLDQPERRHARRRSRCWPTMPRRCRSISSLGFAEAYSYHYRRPVS